MTETDMFLNPREAKERFDKMPTCKHDFQGKCAIAERKDKKVQGDYCVACMVTELSNSLIHKNDPLAMHFLDVLTRYLVKKGIIGKEGLEP